MGARGTSAKSKQSNDTPKSKLDAYRAMSTSEASAYVDGIKKTNKAGLNNNSRFQGLTDQLDMHGKPVVVDDATFDKEFATKGLDGVEIHRGIGYQTDSDVIDSIKFGDLSYMGDGYHGDGIYFTTRKSYAKYYTEDPYSSKNNYGDPKYSTFTAYIDKTKANAVAEDVISKQLMNEPSSVRSGFLSMGNGGISAYALHKGYNVIYCAGGNYPSMGKNNKNCGDFYVVLDRSVLVIRDNTKIK